MRRQPVRNLGGKAGRIFFQITLPLTLPGMISGAVLVFTLGLTEAWMSRADGAVFSACPGTVAGDFDANRHAFHNMSALEVASDLSEFIREVRKLNGLLRIILTGSPVPLVATATGEHVLPATIYSKSVLRVAAEEVVRANEDVAYFPAYEIVTGPQGLLGQIGEARTEIDPEGKVFVMGELWNAHAPARVRMGEHVVVRKVEGLELEVERTP